MGYTDTHPRNDIMQRRTFHDNTDLYNFLKANECDGLIEIVEEDEEEEEGSSWFSEEGSFEASEAYTNSLEAQKIDKVISNFLDLDPRKTYKLCRERLSKPTLRAMRQELTHLSQMREDEATKARSIHKPYPSTSP